MSTYTYTVLMLRYLKSRNLTGVIFVQSFSVSQKLEEADDLTERVTRMKRKRGKLPGSCDLRESGGRWDIYF